MTLRELVARVPHADNGHYEQSVGQAGIIASYKHVGKDCLRCLFDALPAFLLYADLDKLAKAVAIVEKLPRLAKKWEDRAALSSSHLVSAAKHGCAAELRALLAPAGKEEGNGTEI